jgi:hypothetical protein
MNNKKDNVTGQHFSIHVANGKYYVYIVTTKDKKTSVDIVRLG